ncbi:hypothetical protein [Pseudomonas sp. Marseille-P9899]|uniref:hypothetical protein n=1 Tax=Pseudomonas sp. Marseille-P9899 TaxID=2730401 RepID=UPI00158F440D|nr:hypothetical protein [Pseudomonas sp. Marseille-P9899]
MAGANWNALLPSRKTMKEMSAEELDAAGQASNDCVAILAHGISGIGNLLACAASNDQVGLNASAVTDIGWMLESLGSLISNLTDTGAEATARLPEVKPGA